MAATGKQFSPCLNKGLRDDIPNYLLGKSYSISLTLRLGGVSHPFPSEDDNSRFGYNQGWAFLLTLSFFQHLKTRVSNWELEANSAAGSKLSHGGPLANLAMVRVQQTQI